MTYHEDFTLPREITELVNDNGFDILPELLRLIFNTAMEVERENHLGAAAYQRTPERRGHANGFKPKTVQTRVGEVTFAIPQVRDGTFYPSALEKGLRSERALHLALAEMYLQGVSTRKVSAILEQLCGSDVSSTQVSRAAKLLDEALEAWRTRPLGEMRYLFLDAHFEKVRENGQIRDAAVLIASGVNLEGKREILGVSVSLSEHEQHWRTFLQSLVLRGLCGVQLIISDDHAGLKAARQTVFGGIPWQRCLRPSGSDFTCSRMRKPMCRAKNCAPKSLPTFGRFSMRRIAPPPKRICAKPCKSISKRRRPLPPGWNAICRKASPSLRFRKRISAACGP